MNIYMAKRVAALFLTAAVGVMSAVPTQYEVRASEIQGNNVQDAGDLITEDPVDDELSEEIAEASTQAEKNGSNMLPLPESAELNDSTHRTLKAAAVLPKKYMNTLAELKKKYPNPRNQGNDGLCWAYTCIALSEIGSINNSLSKRGVNYSELQLAYFTSHSQADPLGGTSKDSMKSSGKTFISQGGNMYYAMHALANWTGPVNESSMSMSDSEMLLSAVSGTVPAKYAYSKDVAHLENAYVIDPTQASGRKAAKYLIQKYGAVGIGFYMSSRYYDKDTNSLYTGEKSSRANHAVAIVGWDDTKKTRASSAGAWLVRNSWSSSSTMNINSYFWIPYTETSILNEAYAFDIGSQNNYSRNYHYDGIVTCYPYKFLTSDSGKGVCKQAANIFTAKADESLSAVSFSSEDAGLGYKVSVYTDPNNSSPMSGTLAGTTSGKLEFGGINRIELKKPVALTSGQRFSVVISLTDNVSSGFNFEYGESIRTLGFSDTKATIPSNSSYVYLSGKWYNMSSAIEGSTSPHYGIGNVCIKAFTKDENYPKSTEKVDNSGVQDEALPGTNGEKDSTAATSDTSKKTAKVVKNPAKVKKLRVTKHTKSSISLKWNKVKSANGYYVYRRRGTKGKWKRIRIIKKGSYVKCKSKKLKRKTTYYFRVKAYKKVDGRKYFGKYSKKVKKKTK